MAAALLLPAMAAVLLHVSSTLLPLRTDAIDACDSLLAFPASYADVRGALTVSIGVNIAPTDARNMATRPTAHLSRLVSANSLRFIRALSRRFLAGILRSIECSAALPPPV